MSASIVMADTKVINEFVKKPPRCTGHALVQRLHAVFPITPSIAQRGGVLLGQSQAQGIIRSAPDMLISATAPEHQLVLASRHVRDFLAAVCKWSTRLSRHRCAGASHDGVCSVACFTLKIRAACSLFISVRWYKTP